MWLYDSSVGKKVVMSVTGIALILFLTFHACMNIVAVFSADAYNSVCEFLGSNWYAVAGTLVLAFLVVLHFVYAFILTLENRKARGNNRYAVTSRPDKVEWASQNMFVLGLIVILGLCLHLYNFWANMMLAELTGNAGACGIDPTDGAAFIAQTFGNPVYAIIYIEENLAAQLGGELPIHVWRDGQPHGPRAHAVGSRVGAHPVESIEEGVG